RQGAPGDLPGGVDLPGIVRRGVGGGWEFFPNFQPDDPRQDRRGPDRPPAEDRAAGGAVREPSPQHFATGRPHRDRGQSVAGVWPPAVREVDLVRRSYESFERCPARFGAETSPRATGIYAQPNHDLYSVRTSRKA